jgi:hypothetical protein
MDEYAGMFDLSGQDLRKRFIDCAGGPSSFNAEMTAQGRSVVSCDPIYEHDGGEIAERVAETYGPMLDSVGAERDRFVWSRFSNPAHLGEERMRAMSRFLRDYDEGRAEGRYVAAALPDLPFEDGRFDIALSPHLLFLYSDQLTVGFHVDSIVEMLRVAREVRVFPLLDMRGRRSGHLEAVIELLGRRGIAVRVRKVPYEFQQSGDEAMFVSG